GLLFTIPLWSGTAISQEITDPQHIAIRYNEKVIETHQLEIAYSQSLTIPQEGWQATSVNALRNLNDIRPFKEKPATVWLRYRFDRSKLDSDQLAFMMDVSRRGLNIYLNGVDIFAHNATINDQKNTWNSPIFVQLPRQTLLAKTNEIAMRIETTYSLGWNGGLVSVGPFETMRKIYEFRHLVDNIGPRIITNIMFYLSCAFLLFWTARRKDFEFLWLAFCGFVWSALNWHLFVRAPPFDPWFFENLASLLNYAFLVATLGFTGYFMKLPRFKAFILAVSCLTSVIAIGHFIWMYFLGDNYKFYMSIFVISIAAIIYYIIECFKRPTLEKLVATMAMVISVGFSFHDYGFLTLYWRGTNIFMQPYGSIFLFSSFSFVIGMRVVFAFNNLEKMNEVLDSEVKMATDKLLILEAAKRSLDIAAALENERGRLMREIHDGIGSNLITTLAITKMQPSSAAVVPVLQRAITDLRLAVDSLEPIEGDVVALLANLRHRIEPDLNDAGLKFVWKVEEAPPIEWLDAISSLHILRILQEAFANIVSHANAKTIFVSCAAALQDGRLGVLVIIQDDGSGLAEPARANGRGITNMKTRAAAIGGALDVASNHLGTKVSLWLPFDLY
ncbi:MAG: putative signal transduction histidine kinase, partial [Hyphomonadaceae bacterium]